jgi:hypothetical protein
MRATDTPPLIDPTLPEVTVAVMKIRSWIQTLQREEPDWTAHQIAREARRRSVRALLTAIEAADGARRVRWSRVGPRR